MDMRLVPLRRVHEAVWQHVADMVCDPASLPENNEGRIDLPRIKEEALVALGKGRATYPHLCVLCHLYGNSKAYPNRLFPGQGMDRYRAAQEALGIRDVWVPLCPACPLGTCTVCHLSEEGCKIQLFGGRTPYGFLASVRKADLMQDNEVLKRAVSAALYIRDVPLGKGGEELTYAMLEEGNGLQ